ncbi:TonB-dependent receptor [Pontimicrobium sp. IMCC45349]|uniref:TonB-dependent receptor n=1 Tax=Pontimicrobium sp. IMCC45349 TaxID=3391574 RepID=UPI0039A11FA8
MKKIKNIIGVAILLVSANTIAQEERKQTNDTIDTQVVNVVKPYTPKVSDAFKVKEIPSLDDDETTTKKEIKYNIFSIPVASTFTPAKGKAAVVDKAKQEKLYDNYASFGVGTYTSILGEVYLNHALSRSENVGGYISHHSSQGGIDNVLLDDKFSDSKININYSRNLRDYSWNVDAGYRHQVFNWYGLPLSTYDENSVPEIDPQHKYFTFDFGGEIEFDDRMIKKGSMRFRRFADDLESGENRFIAKANIDIPISGELVNTTFKIDYLGGTFDRNYFTNDEFKYGNFQVGLSPSYQLKQDDLTVNLGFSAYYLNDTEASKNKFFVYPKITASYRVVNEVLIAYGGIEGDLIQNSYYDFANNNPFVSPTLFVTPTDQQYNAYVGLKGKLSNNMSYNLRGNYYAENNKALYKNNPLLNVTPHDGYTNGNSFGVVYDDVTTFSIFGELNVDINRNFNLGIKAEYFNYSTDNESEAWNLPDFNASLFMDYQIDEHWFAGANLFYVGERKDVASIEGSLIPEDTSTVMSLESYFDANAHVGYRINERWSAYIKANNIANQDYERFLNYPVQGIQFLAGTTYKFDF